MQDGQPTTLLAGNLHYFRISPEYWADRLDRAAAAGLTAIEVYIPWNWHKPRRDEPADFSSDWCDIAKYFSLAAERGMRVLLRPGPYICAEWEFGGFPWWLRRQDPSMALRTNDGPYVSEVEAWWDELLPFIKPHLWENGGPIVMVQLENEYGNFLNAGGLPPDAEYKEALRKNARKNLGDTVLLYTTDPKSTIHLGGFNSSDVFAAVDFGPNVNPDDAFGAQHTMSPPGRRARIDTELYSGWLTHWGEAMANTSASQLGDELQRVAGDDATGSWSIYMIHGGTNFGWMNGGNIINYGYAPHITSYDYDAPIGEAGDLREKFFVVRNVTAKLRGGKRNLPPVPAQPTLKAYGVAKQVSAASLLADKALSALCSFRGAIPGKTPLPMEDLGETGFGYGVVVYTVAAPRALRIGQPIEVPIPSDRVTVYATPPAGEAVYVGTIYKADVANYLILPQDLPEGGVLTFVVENMGRVNYSPALGGELRGRGLVQTPLLSGAPLEGDWQACVVEAAPPPVRGFAAAPAGDGPVVAEYHFEGGGDAASLGDTWVEVSAAGGWGKGVVWVNGNHLGRYWPSQGPQCNLYVPAPFLRAGTNVVTVLELGDGAAAVAPESVNLVDHPDLTCASKSSGPRRPGSPAVAAAAL